MFPIWLLPGILRGGRCAGWLGRSHRRVARAAARDRVVFRTRWTTVAAGVQETVFEGPVLRQVVPAVILQLPAVMAQPAHHDRGKIFGIQRRDPEPFMFGGFRRKFAPAVVILCQ